MSGDPKGVDDLCLHTYGKFSPSPPYPSTPPSLPPDFYPSLEAQISVLRLKSQPLGPNLSLQARISALRPDIRCKHILTYPNRSSTPHRYLPQLQSQGHVYCWPFNDFEIEKKNILLCFNRAHFKGLTQTCLIVKLPYSQHATYKLKKIIEQYSWASLERISRDWARLCLEVKLPYCQHNNNYKISYQNLL